MKQWTDLHEILRRLRAGPVLATELGDIYDFTQKIVVLKRELPDNFTIGSRWVRVMTKFGRVKCKLYTLRRDSTG